MHCVCTLGLKLATGGELIQRIDSTVFYIFGVDVLLLVKERRSSGGEC